MGDKWYCFVAGLIVALGAVILLITIEGSLVLTKPYMRGQIDALTGKVHYQLVVKADSTRVWQYKK
jgi:hypothetical protein